MNHRVRNLTHAAIIAALYAVLTHLQNLLLPGSASWAIQCRFTEALCVLAFFTPAAIQGLTVGCLLAYGAMKGYSFFTGANHVGWEIPKGIPGAIFSSGFILPLNICVGIIVGCTMYSFYTLFAEKEALLCWISLFSSGITSPPLSCSASASPPCLSIPT